MTLCAFVAGWSDHRMTTTLTNRVRRLLLIGSTIGFTSYAFAVAKPHVTAFGKWISVPMPGGNGDEKPVTVRVRPLLVDTRVKELTLGPVHDITDRLFVVQRAFRVNDSLPMENAPAPQWRWQRGGWLMVDRVSGRVSTINLPEFDVDYSRVSWYRDYGAYCGVSDDGKRVYTVVAQASRRKPVLNQVIEGMRAAESIRPSADQPSLAHPSLTQPSLSPYPLNQPGGPSSSGCTVRGWERGPIRVTFELGGSSRISFIVRGHVADVISEEEDSEEASR
jgi:hypothetical protein